MPGPAQLLTRRYSRGATRCIAIRYPSFIGLYPSEEYRERAGFTVACAPNEAIFLAIRQNASNTTAYSKLASMAESFAKKRSAGCLVFPGSLSDSTRGSGSQVVI